MLLLKTKKSLGLVLTFASSIVLTGCQGLGASSSADPRLDSKAAQHEAKLFGSSGVGACLMGGLGGAAAGAVLGNAVGKDTESTLLGAGIGAAAGCAAGLGANYYLEQQRTAYANKEDRLNAAIKDVRSQNTYIQADINNAKLVIDEDLKTLATLNKQINAKSIENSQAKAALAKIDANIAKLKENRASFQKSLENFQAVSKASKAEGAKTSKLDSEIAETKRKIKAYDAQIASIANQRNAIKLG